MGWTWKSIGPDCVNLSRTRKRRTHTEVTEVTKVFEDCRKWDGLGNRSVGTTFIFSLWPWRPLCESQPHAQTKDSHRGHKGRRGFEDCRKWNGLGNQSVRTTFIFPL